MTVVSATAQALKEWRAKPFSTGESRLIAIEAAVVATLLAVMAQGMWAPPWNTLLISLVGMLGASYGQRTGRASSADLSVVVLACLVFTAGFMNAVGLLAATATLALAEVFSWVEGRSALRSAARWSGVRDSLARTFGWSAAVIASLAAANGTERTVFEAAFRTPLEGLALSAGILVGVSFLIALVWIVWALPRTAAKRLAAGTALPLAASDGLWFCALSGATGIAIDVRAMLSTGLFSDAVGRGSCLALAASVAFFTARLYLPARHDAAIQPLCILYLGDPDSKRVFRSHAARLARRWTNGPVTVVAGPEVALRWGGAHLRSALLRERAGALFPQRAIEFADWLDTLPPPERWQSMPVRELYVRPSLWAELFETRLEAEAAIVVIADREPEETTIQELRALLPTARTTFHLLAGPQKPVIERWPGVEADAIVGAPEAFLSWWLEANATKREQAEKRRYVVIEHDAGDEELAIGLVKALRGKVDANGRTIHPDWIDLGRWPARRFLQRLTLGFLATPGNAWLLRLLRLLRLPFRRYDRLDLLTLLLHRGGVNEFDLLFIESATATTPSLFDARTARHADRVVIVADGEKAPPWRLPIGEYQYVIRKPPGDLQAQVDELATRYLALGVRTSPAPKAEEGASRSVLRRVTRSEIPAAMRWQLSAAWEIESSQIQQYIEEMASSDVGAEIETTPGKRSRKPRLNSRDVSETVNAIYGVMKHPVGADVLAKAHRGELERIAPSAASIRVLGIGAFMMTWITMLSFLFVWLSQGGSMLRVIAGALVVGFSYVSGEGLGRLLMKEESRRALSWMYLIIGLVGLAGVMLNVPQTLGAVGGESELLRQLTLLGEEGTGAFPVVIALLHAAHLARSHKLQKLAAQMFDAQLHVSTQRARQSYEENRWAMLYDEAVKKLGRGRPLAARATPIE